MQQPSCVCEQALQHAFNSVRECVLGEEMEQILSGCEIIVNENGGWMRAYRCRTCGRVWAEGCYARHDTIFYLYPAPETDDLRRWLREEAKDLPE